MRRLLALLLLLALPAPLCASGSDEMIEIQAGEPVSIRPDRAYILLRISRPEGVPRSCPSS